MKFPGESNIDLNTTEKINIFWPQVTNYALFEHIFFRIKVSSVFIGNCSGELPLY